MVVVAVAAAVTAFNGGVVAESVPPSLVAIGVLFSCSSIATPALATAAAEPSAAAASGAGSTTAIALRSNRSNHTCHP